MGDPRKIKNTFKSPSHPWQKVRIEEEGNLLKEYGLKNKTEIWRANSTLKKYKSNAKKLTIAKGKQADLEQQQMIDKLRSLGLLKAEGTVADILSLTIKDVLERRLQSLVFRKSLARSMRQARQFITHEHILIGDKKISVPSYMVTLKEEALIKFDESSQFNDPEHPERQEAKKKEEPEKKPEKKEKHEKKGEKKEVKKEAKTEKTEEKETSAEEESKEEKKDEPTETTEEEAK